MDDLIYLYSCRQFDFDDKVTGKPVTGITFNGFDGNLYPVKFSISESNLTTRYKDLIDFLDTNMKSFKENGISHFSTVTIRPFYNRFGKVSSFEFV
mgnify:FL=1